MGMSERVVSPAWLDDHPTQIIDVREEWEYSGIGHIPSAVNIPFDRFRADEHAAEQGDGEGMLPGEDVFAALFGEAGISREDHVVVYDDHHGVFAARALVTALLYGHPPEKLHLLDGDFSAWQQQRQVSSETPTVESVEYVIERPAETPLVDAETVAAAIDEEDTVIVDTREAWEYDEGHIPGAVRLDWRELVNDETRELKPREDIEAILDAQGIVPEKRILLYCNTARRISHTYTVLSHLGYEGVGFYEGSLTEWEAEGRPTETE